MSLARLSPSLRMLALCAAILAGQATADGRERLPPVRDDIAQRVLACLACHGKPAAGVNNGIFPRIASKPAGYLYNQIALRYPSVNYWPLRRPVSSPEN